MKPILPAIAWIIARSAVMKKERGPAYRRVMLSSRLLPGPIRAAACACVRMPALNSAS